MTVADKLVYLSETKDLLADAINSYTQVITPDTPFREYAQWIDNIVFSAEGGIPFLFDGEAGFAWSGLPYYQDPAGTTEATWGNPVGLISDDSGNGADFTQPTVTARSILRNDPPRLEFDLVDDLLQTTLPAMTNGTLVLAGTNGIWIDDDFNHAGGAFSIGPTTYTNGPAGILSIVGDLIVGGSFAIDRQLTTQERNRVISKLKSMGAPGVFELGPEYFNPALVGNITSGGSFIDGVFYSGEVDQTYTADFGIASALGLSIGDQCVISLTATRTDSGANPLFGFASSSLFAGQPVSSRGVVLQGPSEVDFTSVLPVMVPGNPVRLNIGTPADGSVKNISLRKLELIP